MPKDPEGMFDPADESEEERSLKQDMTFHIEIHEEDAPEYAAPLEDVNYYVEWDLEVAASLEELAPTTQLTIIGTPLVDTGRIFPFDTLSVSVPKEDMSKNSPDDKNPLSTHTLLHWSVAAELGIHPNDLTVKKIEQSIEKSIREENLKHVANGDIVATPETLHETAKKAEQFQKKIAERLRLAPDV